ncbi:uracil-DNA glycosylase [Crenobacter cavernae]|uniref:Uracil-DNA glycosylase n=1 Tax=Crenobacter cavernae TaxID=2290923 RepID=A0A345Y4V5_9NEIS|nr:uracil-DNA glycosylase [Crenobacter cavernae]AXK38957.1 uracil-DNA glycosylase [Crenobacter cavernae]
MNYFDLDRVHPGWRAVLASPTLAEPLARLDAELARRHDAGEIIYPPRRAIFRALEDCAPEDVKVVILGQDPYHGEGEAMGLSFSVTRETRVPPSLRNIYKELATDVDAAFPGHGDLSYLSRQGVLLLNSVLTVRADAAGSHGKLGWQAVTDALIDTVNHANPGCVFLLWGNWAQTKAERIDEARHLILASAHPSPLSARRGFFGARHFSQANAWLAAHGKGGIEWAHEAPADLFA